MNNTQYWIDQIEQTCGTASSNAKTAELLGVTRSSISHAKRGIYALGVRAAVAAAYLLEVHPMLIVTSTQHDSAVSAKNEGDQIFWLTAYMKYADKAPRCINPPITALLPEQP